MKDIFDFKRFGKYFIYDLNNARNTYGISGLITALSPVIAFSAYSLVVLITTGHMSDFPDSLQWMIMMIACISLVISFTGKAYGNLTEKRLGSDWLMIPASALEKTISMILTGCLAVPFILGAVFFTCDWLLSVIFSTYPSALITSFSFKGSETDPIVLNGVNILLSGWVSTMMAFLLGAICFKKAKAGKTILSIFAFNMAIMILAAMIINSSVGLDNGNFEAFLTRIAGEWNAEKAVRILNCLINLLNVTVLAILGGLTYFRVRTMKH